MSDEPNDHASGTRSCPMGMVIILVGQDLVHEGGDDHAGWKRTCTVRVVKFSLSIRICNTLGVEK